MENGNTTTAAFATNTSTSNLGSSDDTQKRLEILNKELSEIANERALYRNEDERLRASMMKSPVKTQKAVAYFGAMLGLFPPCAIFSKAIVTGGASLELSAVLMLTLVNIICAVTGYYSGKMIGKSLVSLEKLSWSKMLFAAPFLGILWGLMTGAAGGLPVFIIGAFFGAFIAAMVGAAALPAFAIFHRLMKKGDVIEEKHFFPIAFGLTAIITAFILGL